MIVKKTFLLSVFVLFGYTYLTKATDDEADTSDKELMAKLLMTVFKCFKDADWNVCGEMLTTKYDITQPKYKKCTCDMACTGEELEMIDKDGKPVPAKFLEHVNKINNPEIKNRLQNIYDKCHDNNNAADKCQLAEQFTQCALKESPELKDRMISLVETLKKMKPK